MQIKSNVLERYSEGAQERVEALCCPVDYDASLLKILPQEIVDRDYGCGDPSRYVRPGDTVLDLGSGGGKICYMAAQLAGETGRIIGVDINDEMLALARKYSQEMADKIGSQPVEFHKGYIQDLALSVDSLENYLAENPVKTADDYQRLNDWQSEQRKANPMIADNSVDLIVSNCVLNLVSESDRAQLISEIHRVLKPGGRVAISDIVSDEYVPAHLQDDPVLWSGCISGAFQEKQFLDAFAAAGFGAIAYDKWDAEPWQVVEGIEFRSVTLTAIKRDEAGRQDRGHALIYKGPLAEVIDEDGYHYPRGERMAVSERTFEFITQGPQADDFIGIAPAQPLDLGSSCGLVGRKRPANETKGGQHASNSEAGGCC